jgi:hypothetical protein
MQSQIYRILAERSGKSLRQIIRDTKRTDLYLDAAKAKEYGLIDEVLGPVTVSTPVEDAASLVGELPALVPTAIPERPAAAVSEDADSPIDESPSV